MARIFVQFGPKVRFHIFILCSSNGVATYCEIAAHSAYEMFSWYKYLIVSLVFSHLGFWSGILFLIAPFPHLCLLVLFYSAYDMFDFLSIRA